MKVDADDMRLLSRLLDEGGALAGPEREAWLDGLDGDAARLRPTLLKMLARQTGGDLDAFLEQPPELTAPRADPPASDFHADDRVGPYRLLRPIGRGGMGEVWLATRADGQLKRSVALKLPMLNVRRSVLVQRFERERDILAALIHPHIARLYDAGVAEDGQPYMALEYVEGTPITDAADDRGLDTRARVQLLRQVMDAVQHAHANLVIHRDLKPGNVLVTADGQARLLDFGVAKLLEGESAPAVDSELTQLGGRALTLRYAAPEQLRGGPIGTGVDIWALGVLLYELLTGLRPFDGERGGSIEQDILAREPRRPSQHGTGAMARLSRSLAADLDTVVLKALKKHPAERYASVGAFADDLDRWLRGEPVRAQRDSRWYRARRFVGRNRLAVATAALAGLALTGTATVAVVLGLQAREESARAMAARDFMVDIFRRADPDLSQGKEVSARQLLLQGHRTVLETMDGQPLLQAELLREIGRALDIMYDLPAADKAFDEAAVRFQRVGNLREAAALTIDRAALRLGSVWEAPVAVELLARAEAMYPGHAGDAEFTARQAVYRSYAAGLDGDEQARQAWYLRARDHAGPGLADTGSRTVLAVRMLALTEGAMNLPQPAAERLAALLGRLQAQKFALPSDTLSVLADLGATERLTGRHRAALARLDAARALCRSALDPKGSQCVYNEFHRSGLLLLLGYEALAMEVVPLLAAPDGPVQTSWGTRRMVQAYEILARNRRLDEHPEVVARVVAAGLSAAVPGTTWQEPLAALDAQARHLLRVGRVQEAMEVSVRAQTLIAARGVGEERFALSAHVLHAMGQHLLGAHGPALQRLERVHDSLVRALGAEHPTTQLASIARVRPLWALQRQAEALALIDRALPILREAMGPQAPTIAAIQALRQDLAAAGPGSMPDLQRVEVFM